MKYLFAEFLSIWLSFNQLLQKRKKFKIFCLIVFTPVRPGSVDIHLIYCVCVIQGQLSPPVITKVMAVNDCHVNLTWSPPRNNRCPLTMYIIHYRKVLNTGADWRHIDVINVTNTFHVMELDCGTLYDIAMSVTNERVKSNKSDSWQVITNSNINGTYILNPTVC